MASQLTRDADVTGFDRGTGGRPTRPLVAALVGLALASLWPLVVGADGLANPGGWTVFTRFWSSALRPELSPDFLAVTVRATVTTIGYAVLGSVGAVVIGVVGGASLSRLWWARDGVGRRRRTAASGRGGWRALRVAWSVPRGIHEAVWGLLLLNVLGRDPLVAVLALAVPFGAITAKVYAEMLDEQPDACFRAIREAGAGRLVALAYGTLPSVTRDLVSYAFYRFECSIRSAVVLGILGAGGLGFQLALSFQSLRYAEMWTLVYALVAVSAAADAWSAALRHEPTREVVRGSLALVAILVAVAWHVLDVDLGTLWAGRTRDLAARLADDALPPGLPRGGLGELLSSAWATLRMSVIASLLATGGASAAAVLAARRGQTGPRRLGPAAGRLLLLVCRAIPPPVWALVLLFVMVPGILPGAVALGLYNLGILGRLFAEVVENGDPLPGRAIGELGAPALVRLAYGELPLVAPRLLSLALYRWEVTMRETVIVGLVGAGGLGRVLALQQAAFDYGGMVTTVGTLVLLTLGVDAVSARTRAALR